MPELDLRIFRISDVFAHYLPNPGTEEGPNLTGAKCELDTGTRDRIGLNFQKSLDKQLLRLHFADETNVFARNEISCFLQGKVSLKETSQRLARYLFSNTPRTSTPGMLLVARASCGTRKALAIMKYEDDLKIAYNPKTTPGGGLMFDLSQIPTLGIGQRLIFKAALFTEPSSPAAPNDIEIVASDHQWSGEDGRGMADFFLKKFLGCALNEDAGTVYKHTLEALLDLASEIPDAVLRSKVATAIVTLSDNDDPTLHLDNLTSDVVPEQYRPIWDEGLQVRGIQAIEISKDTSQLDDLRYLSCTLSNGMRIIGPKDAMIREITTNDEQGFPVIRIDASVLDFKYRKSNR